MGTVTRSYAGSNGYATFYVSYAYPDSITVSGSTFTYEDLMPTAASAGIAWNYSVGTLIQGGVNTSLSLEGSGQGWNVSASQGFVPWSNGAWKSLYKTGRSSSVKQTSSIFNSTNPTSPYVTVSSWAQHGGAQAITDYYDSSAGLTDTIPVSQKIYLDAPPTFKVIDSGGTETTSVEFDTAYVYSGLTTASVAVGNLSAKYGGSISSVAFTIGNQTVTRSDAGTLSILLNAGGTFTPKVTVTDSRGQTTTKTLDSITVNTYTAPSVSFDVARTLNDGTPDDEGTYGLIEAELTFSDVVATAVAPSVVLTDDNGLQTTPTVTWYTDDTLATQVTWANVSSGDTVYGLFSGLSTQHSYQVSVRPHDSEGTGTAVTQTIAPAFYTVDFLAGGHGIAFGKPASNTGFECAMTATFEDTATFGSDIYIDLSDYQTTGSVDKELYDAIVALGWESDVLVN